MDAKSQPQITSLKVENFRALQNVEIKDLTPLTVLLGPNGCGKSTVFDVLAFLSECFESGLKGAWERRGKAKELKSRGCQGAVVIEISYREAPQSPLMKYRLEVDEEGGSPHVSNEWLKIVSASGRTETILSKESIGIVSYVPEYMADRNRASLLAGAAFSSPDILAVNAFGQFNDYPHAVALRDFIMRWHIAYLLSSGAREQAEPGSQEHLNKTGSNLANVIQFYQEKHPRLLQDIFSKLRSRIPRMQDVSAFSGIDGKLLLQIHDAPFKEPILARFASDGTLKMLAYLVLLNDPHPPPFIGLEEPENFLHPRLLYELAEECRSAAATLQILATTHSPFFLNALRPEEVRVLWRDDKGYTQCHPLSSDDRIRTMVDNGSQLGYLWMEGHFGVGDPLTRGGGKSPRLDGALSKQGKTG